MPEKPPPMLTATDGLRAPTLPRDPRRPLTGGTTPDPGIAPYDPAPRPPAKSEPFNVPRNFSFFTTPDLGAPPVGLPSLARTRGRLQRSGEAFGSFTEPKRITAALPIQEPTV